MMTKEVTLGAGILMTPDFAAKLAQQASHFDATVFMQSGSTRLCVDSLIGMLAMSLKQGMRVVLEAEGADADRAINRIAQLLEGGE